MQLKAAHSGVVDEVRRRELAEEHLRQSQKMEAISQLTGDLAPDFKQHAGRACICSGTRLNRGDNHIRNRICFS